MNPIVDSERIFLSLLAETSLNPELWPEFMNTFTKHFNLNACHLMVVSDKTHAPRFHLAAGKPTEEKFIESYTEQYITKDMIMAKARASEPGSFHATNHYDDKEQYYNSSYYKEWALPQGLSEGAAGCIFINGDWRCLMVHNRTLQQGEYSHSEIERMNALIPYIERAVKVSYVQSELDKDSAKANAIVNGYRAPVAILTEYGEVWAMNRLMEQLIEDSDALYVKDKCLHLSNKHTDKLLTTGIFKAAKEIEGINLTLPNSVKVNDNIILSFKGITDREDGKSILKGIIVYAISSHYRARVSNNTLTTLFSLTPSEATVCSHLMEGRELKEIAKLENKSVHTVREQLYQSFRKTGCKSQTSLINMLATIPVFDD